MIRILAMTMAGVAVCLTTLSHAEAVEEVPWVEAVDPGWEFTSGQWEQAMMINDFMQPGAFSVMGRSFSTEAAVSTEVYALRTSEALYLGVICHDDEGLARKAGKKTDSSGIPMGNKFEIYVDGDLNEHQSYYQFIINPDGAAWLSKKGQVIPAETWPHAAQQEEKAWKFWVRIPYDVININPETEVINVNFFRNYQPLQEPQTPQYSTWQGAAPASFASLRALHLGRP